MDKEAVIKQLAQEWHTEPVRPDEMTITEFVSLSQKNGTSVSRDVANRKLSEMVEQGYLRLRKAKKISDGGTCNAYSPAEGKSWEDVLKYIK